MGIAPDTLERPSSRHNITSTGRKRDLVFKGIDWQNEQTVRFECSRWKAFLQSHF